MNELFLLIHQYLVSGVLTASQADAIMIASGAEDWPGWET